MIWILAVTLYVLGFLGCFAFVTIANDNMLEPASHRASFFWSLLWPAVAMMVFIIVLWSCLSPETLDDVDDTNCGSGQ